MNLNTKFKVGDIVEASGAIWRKDRKSKLKPGDRATVIAVWQARPDSPQIIDLNIDFHKPIKDIVCFDNVPLHLVSRK